MAMVRMSAEASSSDDQRSADLTEVLQEVVALVRPTSRQRGVRIDIDEYDEECAVALSPVMVRKILAQVLHALCAGLEKGESVTASVIPGAGVAFRPSTEVAKGRRRDDWRASALGLWVARQLLAQAGGMLEEPETNGSPAWRVLFPRGSEA